MIFMDSSDRKVSFLKCQLWRVIGFAISYNSGFFYTIMNVLNINIYLKK